MSRSRLVAATAAALGILVTVLVALVANSTTAGANPVRPPTTVVAAASAPADLPAATSADASSTVGPLFAGGLAGGHSCTGSVVASPAKDLVLTAAHCLSGTVAGWVFAPGYDGGQTPYGAWTVVHVYLPKQWLADQNPHFDYAILQVASQVSDGRTVNVEDITGGDVVGLAPQPGEAVTDIAYNGGRDDEPISCTTTAQVSSGYPTFDCHGYIGGSSGSPWLSPIAGSPSTYTVRGVIGGLNQGGCYDYRSYSAPFTSAVYALLFRATFGIHPDTAPVPGGDGC